MNPDPKSQEGAGEEPPATVSLDGASPAGSNSWGELLRPGESAGHLGTLGHFEIAEFVGRGGMGLVFRAWDSKLRRTVAIKMLSPVLAADNIATKRLLREAQSAAAINDDHVVTVFSVHEDNNPPYIAMEFVDGISLQELLGKGPIEVEQIVEIGRQVALGLSAAHSKGLIHRDIKPANILLEAGNRVKVGDFGLAHSVYDDKITQTGQIGGTPDYMSPEQAEGVALDFRSDIFSLGSLMFAMCVGHPPFQAGSPLATLRRVCDEEPPSIRSLRSEVPRWLEEVVSWMMNKDSQKRPQSALDVAEALLQKCGCHVNLNGPPSLQEVPKKRPTHVAHHWLTARPRRFILWSAIVGILIVAGFAIYAVSSPRPPVQGAKQWSNAEGGNDHWYFVGVVPGGITWDQAHEKALGMGGHLATIGSREEDDFIVRLLQDQTYWIANSVGGFNQGPWIGAVQIKSGREPDGGWRWITGEEFVYSNWHADKEIPHSQPNDGQTPYTVQNKIFYHVRGGDYLKAAWGDATSGGSVVRSFVVEFDGERTISKHPKTDSYASLVVDGGTGFKRTGLILRGRGVWEDTGGLMRLDFDLRRTIFVPPGKYRWELLDISDSGGVFKKGTVTVSAGQRVNLTPDKGPKPEG